ncbi:MAG: tetratricopeptide repeat protein [Promethearchaeota archaeon]
MRELPRIFEPPVPLEFDITGWDDLSNKLTLRQLFDRINPQKNACTILAGAGISLDPPSNLPTGYQFTRTLLQNIVINEELQSILQLMNPTREGMRSPGDFLRFEELVESLQKNIDPDLTILKSYEVCNTPNRNHVVLAHLITKGWSVFTTNIDSLIEYGILFLGISQNQIFPVITKEEYEHPIPEINYPVYKLHGSLVNLRTREKCFQSLQVTLSQITKAEGSELQLDYWKKIVLEQHLKDNLLIVIGYSGLDDFDIVPTLGNIISKEPVLWITHDENTSVENAKIFVYGEVEYSQKNRKYFSDRVEKQLERLFSPRGSLSSNIYRIFVHTGQFLKWILEFFHLNHVELPDHPQYQENPINLLEQNISFLKIDKTFSTYFTAEIYHNYNNPSKALRYYQKAMKLTENPQYKAIALKNIGTILYNQGKIEDALTSLQQSLDYTNHLKNFSGKSLVLANIANIYHNQGRIQEALELNHKAKEIAEKLEDQESRVSILKDLGVLYTEQGNYEKAHEMMEKALNLSKELGDLRTKTWILIQMGVTNWKKGDFDKADDYYREANKINEKTGYLKARSFLLENKGLLSYEEGNLERAFDDYKEALEINNLNQDNLANISLYINLGNVYYSAGIPSEAMKCYQEAMEISNKSQVQNVEKRAAFLGGMSTILAGKGLINKLSDYLPELLEIADQILDVNVKAKTFNSIGKILHHLKQTDKALDYLYRAMSIAEDLNNITLKGQSLILIGDVLSDNPNNVQEAYNKYSKALKLAEESDDEYLKTEALCQMALYNYKLKKYQEVFNIVHFDIQDDSCDTSRIHRSKLAYIMFIAGKSMFKAGHIQAGLMSMLGSLKTYYETMDPSREKVICQIDAGVCCHSLREVSEDWKTQADEYFQEALENCHQLEDPLSRITLLEYMGNSLQEIGDIPKAIQYYQEAYNLALDHKIQDKIDLLEEKIKS